MKTKTYTRNDIIDKISYKLDMNYEESKIILESVLDSFTELLVSDFNRTRIELRNFGIFDVYKTKKRTNARNPKTKENVVIPPRKKIVFKSSKHVRKILNNQLS